MCSLAQDAAAAQRHVIERAGDGIRRTPIGRAPPDSRVRMCSLAQDAAAAQRHVIERAGDGNRTRAVSLGS